MGQHDIWARVSPDNIQPETVENADENKGLLKEKGIDAIPVVELYKDGKLIWKHSGEIDEATLLKETKL